MGTTVFNDNKIPRTLYNKNVEGTITHLTWGAPKETVLTKCEYDIYLPVRTEGFISNASFASPLIKL
jgi:hypothetical protein